MSKCWRCAKVFAPKYKNRDRYCSTACSWPKAKPRLYAPLWAPAECECGRGVKMTGADACRGCRALDGEMPADNLVISVMRTAHGRVSAADLGELLGAGFTYAQKQLAAACRKGTIRAHRMPVNGGHALEYSMS